MATRALKPIGGGGRLYVKLTAKARVDRLKPATSDARGRRRGNAGVTAPPERGQANRALVALLARRLGWAKPAIEIVAGETRCEKTLGITAEPAALENRLAELLDPDPVERESTQP